jgi:CheY-like chemotaxis protein
MDGTASTGTEKDGRAAAGAAPRALIVDDNAVNRKVTGHMLRRLGWHSDEVESGALAIERLRVQAYDLVLLDLRMQEMDGEETCRRIRRDLGLADLHIVAYTAHGMEDDRARILAAGFDRMLIKPIFLDDLRALCAQVRPRR